MIAGNFLGEEDLGSLGSWVSCYLVSGGTAHMIFAQITPATSMGGWSSWANLGASGALIVLVVWLIMKGFPAMFLKYIEASEKEREDFAELLQSQSKDWNESYEKQRDEFRTELKTQREEFRSELASQRTDHMKVIKELTKQE